MSRSNYYYINKISICPNPKCAKQIVSLNTNGTANYKTDFFEVDPACDCYHGMLHSRVILDIETDSEGNIEKMRVIK